MVEIIIMTEKIMKFVLSLCNTGRIQIHLAIIYYTVSFTGWCWPMADHLLCGCRDLRHGGCGLWYLCVRWSPKMGRGTTWVPAIFGRSRKRSLSTVLHRYFKLSVKHQYGIGPFSYPQMHVYHQTKEVLAADKRNICCIKGITFI